MQKCQKYGVLNRKVNFSHLFLDITSQFFHTIIYESCSFYSCKKSGIEIHQLTEKRSEVEPENRIFENAYEKIQDVYHSTQLIELNNLI